MNLNRTTSRLSDLNDWDRQKLRLVEQSLHDIETLEIELRQSRFMTGEALKIVQKSIVGYYSMLGDSLGKLLYFI